MSLFRRNIIDKKLGTAEYIMSKEIVNTNFVLNGSFEIDLEMKVFEPYVRCILFGTYGYGAGFAIEYYQDGRIRFYWDGRVNVYSTNTFLIQNQNISVHVSYNKTSGSLIGIVNGVEELNTTIFYSNSAAERIFGDSRQMGSPCIKSLHFRCDTGERYYSFTKRRDVVYMLEEVSGNKQVLTNAV